MPIMLYELPGMRAEIIRPHMPLSNWLATQKQRPFALINASLYETKNGEVLPCGTVIENGKVKVNSGTGYGFGTINGNWYFGTPWVYAWQEYLTGYTGLVQDGNYVPPAFKDSYVFDCKLSRIGLGSDGNNLVIGVADGVDIYTFGKQAQQEGLKSFINLDGGGSRFLFVDGKTIYTSDRTPYNAIAFYRNEEEEKPMSDSSLVNYIKLSPNCTTRTHAIDTITIHHAAGVASVESLGALFASTSRQASSNYGIGNDGRIAMFVPENKRAMTSSNTANDNRAVTIEVSNSSAVYPWLVSDAAYKSLIKLVADICKRNGITRLLWRDSKVERVNRQNGANMTVHRDFVATQCPGDYLMSKMTAIADEVNALLTPTETEKKPSGYDAWLECYNWYQKHH